MRSGLAGLFNTWKWAFGYYFEIPWKARRSTNTDTKQARKTNLIKYHAEQMWETNEGRFLVNLFQV